jgi:hypothetical protein
MRLLKIVFLFAVLFGAYRWWDGKRSDELVATAGQHTFVPVQMPNGAPEHAVLVLAPPNCPSDEAQRAEALVQHLVEHGIPVKKGNTMSFDVVNPTAEQRAGVERAVAVFKRGAPAVFIKGMAMSNPTPAQAVAEYRRTHHGP